MAAPWLAIFRTPSIAFTHLMLFLDSIQDDQAISEIQSELHHKCIWGSLFQAMSEEEQFPQTISTIASTPEQNFVLDISE